MGDRNDEHPDADQHRTGRGLVGHWRTYEAIEHVGAANRHVRSGIKIIDELKARSGGRLSQLLPLLDHPDPELRYAVAVQFRQIDPDVFRSALKLLQMEGGDVGRNAAVLLAAPPLQMPKPRPPLPADAPILWQSRHPPPPALDLSSITRLLRESLPAESDAILRLARPAIGLWPQAPRGDIPMQASRLGGMPNAPPGFVWPVRGGEPLLFLGQINCADIQSLPGAQHFPSRGLLAMFGDHDTINGCMFTALGGVIYYWPDIDDLSPVLPPLEPSDVFLVCELAFRPMIDMPHVETTAVRTLLPDAQYDAYCAFHHAVRHAGIPNTAEVCSFGKLLGWPDLVQGDDLTGFLDDIDQDFRLLIQLDGYANGTDAQGWGPGGSLYFMIGERDLAKGRIETAQLTAQFT